MNTERAIAIAILLVVAAAAVGIYAENKSSEIALNQGIPKTRGRPLAN